MRAIKNVFNKLGIDGAIMFTSIFRLLQASSGLISILFVWFYRACIGHWALKSVRVFYKKL